MKIPLSQRLLAGTAHLIAMAGVLYMIVNLIGLPVFHRYSFYFLIPNAIFALVTIFWSPYVRGHLLQALTVQVVGLLFGAVPWLMRLLASTGTLGERWFYTGWEGSGATPYWSLMVAVIVFGFGLWMFAAATEGAVRGYTGQPFRYPLIGKLISKLTA